MYFFWQMNLLNWSFIGLSRGRGSGQRTDATDWSPWLAASARILSKNNLVAWVLDQTWIWSEWASNKKLSAIKRAGTFKLTNQDLSWIIESSLKRHEKLRQYPKQANKRALVKLPPLTFSGQFPTISDLNAAGVKESLSWLCLSLLVWPEYLSNETSSSPELWSIFTPHHQICSLDSWQLDEAPVMRLATTSLGEPLISYQNRNYNNQLILETWSNFDVGDSNLYRVILEIFC